MFEKPKALLFDDDVDTVDITKDTLEEEFDVTWVATKEELDEKIEREHYNVIVTDVSIESARQTGPEMVDEIRVKYRVTRTPVVVYSAVRNVAEIKKSQNRLFFAYVEKIGRNWQDVLIKDCLRAVKADRNFVSWNVFESYFEQIVDLDTIIDPGEIPDAFILGIDLGQKQTIRSLIALIKNKDLDDATWETLENTLWKIYCRYLDKKGKNL